MNVPRDVRNPASLSGVRRDKLAASKSPVTDFAFESSNFGHQHEGAAYHDIVGTARMHSPTSNTSNASCSPPAPAQDTSPAPAPRNERSSSFAHLTPTTPSRTPFVEEHSFNVFKNEEHKGGTKGKSTTNGWSREMSSIYDKKSPLELGLEYSTSGAAQSVSALHNAQATSPMPIGNEPLAQLLITLKEQNKSLIREIEDLRIKLEDAEGDLKLVRCQMRSMSKQMDSVVIESNRDRLLDESILTELQLYKEKVMLLERDLQSVLDEKEELVIARDDLTLKNDRLNEHLISMMRNMSGESRNYTDNSLTYDVDALYLENRYLKEKVKNEEDEKRLLLDRLAKYKDLMDQHQRSESGSKKKHTSAPNESIDSTLTTLQLPGGRVVSARDVERLLNSDSIHSMEVNKSNQLYLWNLLAALFEGLQNKNMNLVHARKANRLLGKRVEELETHMHGFEMECRFPKHRSSGKSPHNSSRNESTSAHGASNLTRHSEGLITPDPLDSTDGNISTPPLVKETSEEENDELSSTAISTPSTARRSLSIEQHLQALQNDALSDSLPLTHPTKHDFNSSQIHLHRPNRAGSNHRYEFNLDYDTRKPSNSTLYN